MALNNNVIAIISTKLVKLAHSKWACSPQDSMHIILKWIAPCLIHRLHTTVCILGKMYYLDFRV